MAQAYGGGGGGDLTAVAGPRSPRWGCRRTRRRAAAHAGGHSGQRVKFTRILFTIQIQAFTFDSWRLGCISAQVELNLSLLRSTVIFGIRWGS